MKDWYIDYWGLIGYILLFVGLSGYVIMLLYYFGVV